METTRTQKWIAGAGIAAFVYLASVIVVMASERVYWYWAGFNFESVLFLGSFYLIPTAGALWVLAKSRATHLHHVILAGAIFGFLTEGVLTPVIYSDGPFPLFAAMFTGWHGMIAFVGFLFLIRKWLIEGRTRLLGLASAGFGALWGIWAIAASVGDSGSIASDSVHTSTMDPGTFAVYAIGVGTTLAVSHWLMGWVWPTKWNPSRQFTIALFGISAGYMAIAVLLFVPWAPAKLAVMLGGTYWLATRGRIERDTDATILEKLHGRVSARNVSVLLLMPAIASATYAITWMLRLSDGVLQGVAGVFIAAQVIGGAGAYIWAARRAIRQPNRTSAVDVHV